MKNALMMLVIICCHMLYLVMYVNIFDYLVFNREGVSL